MISLIVPLDHERTSQFFLTIEASDGGVPRLTATTIVKLNVTDVNDNAPTFAMPVYGATLREDVRLQHSVIQVGGDNLGEAVFCFIRVKGETPVIGIVFQTE